MKKVFLSILLVMFLATAAFAKVNLNTASVDELKELPGIGAAKAEAIVKYREENGKFKKKEDIVSVKGIGDKVYEKISTDIEVSE
jgi:competence protein ComEA